MVRHKMSSWNAEQNQLQWSLWHSTRWIEPFLRLFLATWEPTVKTSPTQHATSLFEQITEHQIRLQLKQIDTCNSPGSDKIYPALLKRCADQLATIITILFNIVIVKKTSPTKWKTSLIKPIPKISNSKARKDYCPIVITCHLYKVVEKLV